MNSKKSLMILSVCVVLAGLMGCKDKGRIVEPKEGPAHLVIPQQNWELGDHSIKEGVIQQDVLLINDGSEPLIITDVENLCHCTRTEFPDHPIRPGHGGRLKVFLDMTQISAGDYTRTVIVNSNGGSIAIDFSGVRTN